MSRDPHERPPIRNIVRGKPLTGPQKVLVGGAILVGFLLAGAAGLGGLIRLGDILRDRNGRMPVVHPGAIPPRPKVADGPLEDNAALRQRLSDFFARLANDWGQQDRDKIARHFDIDRMLDELCTVARLPPPTPAERAQAVEGFRASIKNNWAGARVWTSTDIRNVIVLNDRDVLVTTRHFDQATGENSHRRWWLRVDGPEIRLYDLEDLDLNIRMCLLAGRAIAGVRVDGAQQWLRATQFVRNISRAVQQRDQKATEAELAAVKNERFPNEVEALRWLVHGTVAVWQKQYKQALEHYARAEQFNPKFPILDLRRAECYNFTRESEKARFHAQRFIGALGEDNEVCYHLGMALANLGRRQEAAAVLRRALKFDPDGALAIDELRRVLDPGNKAEIGDHFARLSRPADQYDLLAKNAFEARDVAGLTALADVMHKRFPEDPEALFHLAHVRAIERNWPLAWPLYQSALAKQADNNRRIVYSDNFLYDLVDDGKVLEGYQKAADKVRTFRVLAADLLGQRKLLDLAQLLDLHQKEQPQETLLEYYRGELALTDSCFLDAGKHFAKVNAGQLDEALRKRYLSRRLFAGYKAGNGLATYLEMGASSEGFEQLAGLLAQSKATPRLKELVDQHRRKAPNDPKLPLWEAETHWLDKDYAATWKVLVAHRQSLFEHPLQGRKWRARAVECLFGLKKEKELEDLVRALRKTGTRDDRWRLADIVTYLRQEKKYAEILAFATAYHKLAPNQAHSTWLLARAYVLNHRPEQGVQYFRVAWNLPLNLEELQDQSRPFYQNMFLHDMVDTGQVLAGYQAASDTRSAFLTLARDLMPRRKWEDLRKLLQAHQQKQADDPWLPFYQGELALQDRQYALADKFFTAGQAAATDKSIRDSYRYHLMSARLHTQGAAATYQEFGPGEPTFHQLADYCTRPEDAGQLEQLLAAHRNQAPDARRLRIWEAEVKWLAGDYRQTVALLRKYRTDILAERFQVWKYEDRLIRSLIRLKDFAAAQKELAALDREKRPNLLLEVVLAANSGDVAATTKALQRCKDRDFYFGSLYSDTDLGPILRSEPFRRVREQFPETTQLAYDPYDDLDD
jgi:hypothetical protein